jgi:hypothetical protein
VEDRIIILAGAGLLVLVAFVFLISSIVSARRARRRVLQMSYPTTAPEPGLMDAPIDTADWMPRDDGGTGGTAPTRVAAAGETTALPSSDVVPGELLMSVEQLIRQHAEVPAPSVVPAGGRPLDELLAEIAVMAEGTGPAPMPPAPAPPAPVSEPMPPAPVPEPAPVVVEPIPLAAWLVERPVSAPAPVATAEPVPRYSMIAPVELSFADSAGRVGVRPGTATHLKYQRLAQVLLADLHKTTPHA